MASHPAKRRRTEPGPSHAGHAQLSDPSPAPAARVTAPHSSPAEPHATPTRPPRPLSVPENMTMPVHEALEYIDPHDSTPHDLYLVLIYAAAAHSDVAEMMDRFACVHRDRVLLQREMRELPATTGSTAQFVPVLPKPPRVRPGRPHGPARPKEVIEAEKADKAARKAARLEARAARPPKVNNPAREKRPKPSVQDKDFTYLVRRAEVELGSNGKYDDDKTVLRQDWSQKNKRQYWQEKAVEVKAHMMWLQEQILQNMTDRERRQKQGVIVDAATFGTKKNGLVAMKDLLRTILVDTGELGRQLRVKWFSEFLEKFKQAICLLKPEESAALRQDREWSKELRSLTAVLRERGFTEEGLDGVLTQIAPDATIEINSSSDDGEDSDVLVSLNGSDEDSTYETDESLVGGRFLEQVHFERCSESEAESSEEETSDI
ncbi:hypothetical protein KVR01_001299 [Diaporthe batatas]|uniref:uncharacterized protein n=1 Tax=Diaporthe batatas TaxID=748121 RepID=UPI001D04009C|nr:uncharacterized protein KVR01_001299 [Diaporthe batatas]KAG8168550.1 hypothetical protein KVR01_001299 [Diaporthe batatas]